ncbi:transporter substrate-binding domain-containing protein [Marinobacteraceae bacterium S3BR75-40.1]
MMPSPRRLLSVCLLLIFSCVLWAQEKPLRVGVTNVPPFAMTTEHGNWEGISVDLWQRVAEGIGRDYELVPLSFKELLAQVESGKIDVAVGALTMTAAREEKFDFSHPFYQTGLSIALPPKPEHSLWRSLSALMSWQFFSLILSLAGLLLAVGVAVWLFERRRNPEQFGGSAGQGIGSSFWWAAVTMTTVGYGDKAPVTLGGRLIALVWMFAGLIMVASFTAAITSSLTVSNLQHQINGPGDLRSATVATIDKTASAQYLQEHRIHSVSYPDLETAMHSVLDGETDAIVYDRPLLQFRNQALGEQSLTLLPGVFREQLYALALPEGSPLRGAISQQILDVTESADWKAINQRYLGD